MSWKHKLRATPCPLLTHVITQPRPRKETRHTPHESALRDHKRSTLWLSTVAASSSGRLRRTLPSKPIGGLCEGAHELVLKQLTNLARNDHSSLAFPNKTSLQKHLSVQEHATRHWSSQGWDIGLSHSLNSPYKGLPLT